MPQFLEARLKKAAAEKGFSGKKADRYVYGAMNNMGAMKGSKETAKGKRMQKKHEAKAGGQEKMWTLGDLA
jgi:hypothetical protein